LKKQQDEDDRSKCGFDGVREKFYGESGSDKSHQLFTGRVSALIGCISNSRMKGAESKGRRRFIVRQECPSF
jgi:hypothetical protein